MFLQTRKRDLIKSNAIIHTDHGSQYASVVYRHFLYLDGFRQLMSDSETVAIMLEIKASFLWTSLQREEGYNPKVSLAYLPPEQARRTMMFEMVKYF